MVGSFQALVGFAKLLCGARNFGFGVPGLRAEFLPRVLFLGLLVLERRGFSQVWT